MIDALVFSRDRPAQLELLLRSIAAHAPTLYNSVTVLVKYTDLEFWRGYREVMRPFSYGASTTFWIETEQSSFEQDLRSWLLQWADERISFLVDDDVFYRRAIPVETVPFSFRSGDYEYPFSVDGNVYLRDDVIGLLDDLHFDDPTQLEARAVARAYKLGWQPVYPAPPCLVGIPANRVSPSSNMPHMNQDPAELNRRFLDGGRLAIPDPPAHGSWRAHENLEYLWLTP